MLERRILSGIPPLPPFSVAVRARPGRWYSSEASSSSSTPSSSASSDAPTESQSAQPSESAPSTSEPSETRAGAPASAADLPPEAANLDQLWRNALSAPATALKKAPRTSTKARSLLATSTPTSRVFKGTLHRTRRAEGQTPHEAGILNETLSGILTKLINKPWERDGDSFRVPGTARGKSLNHLTSAPAAGWISRKPRAEEESPELIAAVDALKEELSGVLTPGEAVQWAQANVFARTPEEALHGGETPRPTWPKTYPKALAALIDTLWTRMNSPHLALAMFEHARTLSVESYLDGCQTSAYNQLIRVHWEAFRDLNAVAVAVEEMKASALQWDRYTAGFVGRITEEAGKDLLDARSRNATHRWGSEAYTTLHKLEEALREDKRREQAKYERWTSQKRRARQSGAAPSTW